MARSIVMLFLGAVLLGCAPAPPAASRVPSEQPQQGTPSPTVTDSAAPITPSPSASPVTSSQPSANSPPRAEQYRDGDIVEVLAGGLAVRQGPGTAYTLLDAARWGEGGVEVLGSPYRLRAGEQLVIGQGPLAIDGRDWYSVIHTDDAIQWTPPGDPDSGIQGWIAANEEGALFVRLAAKAPVPCCFVDSGVGPGTTEEVPTLPVSAPGASRGFVLTVGHPELTGSCHVRVTDETDEVLLDETITGWGNPGGWWPGEGGRLHIDTECSWSIRVGNFVG